jgi:hypothetical protein
MFKVPISLWTHNLAFGLCGNSQQDLSYLEVPEKLLGEITSKTDALYPH